MPSLATTYLGLSLKNPLIASSCPLTSRLETARSLEAAGVGAIVVRSIFEEQIREDVAHMYDALAESDSSAALDYLRADLPMRLGPEKYIENLKALRKGLKIPVIASVNCIAPDQWVAFARKIERAGVDALELNVYDIPEDPGEDSAAVETRHAALVSAIQAEVSIPVAVKLSPYYAGLANVALRLQRLGVRGLVLFNRFLQPDIDIETQKLVYRVHLSHPDDLRLPLRWVAILRNLVGCDLALSSGVHDADAAIKALLTGANAVYCCSALYRQPTGSAVGEILKGIEAWMERHGHATLEAFRGQMRETALGDGRGFERAHYVRLVGQAE